VSNLLFQAGCTSIHPFVDPAALWQTLRPGPDTDYFFATILTRPGRFNQVVVHPVG